MTYPCLMQSNKLKEVGNALNSILSFMQRPKALEGFSKLGIKVWADEAQTQFRNVLDVLGELAARWPDVEKNVKIGDMFAKAAQEAGLYSEEVAGAVGIQDKFNDVQAAEAAGLSAGIYRRNYLIALLQNWSKVQDVLIAEENALGYSLRENARTMETYEKKVQALKTALAGLAVAAMDAGLLDRLKEITDGAKNAIETFMEFPPELQKLIIFFGEFAAVLAITQLGMRTFFDVGIRTAVINCAAYVAGISAAQRATLTFGAALKLLATNPIVITITAISTLIYVIYRLVSAKKEFAQETIKSLNGIQQSIEKTQGLIDKTQSLANEYISLAQKTKLTAEEQGKLKNITSEIIAILPAAVEGFTKTGNAILSVASVSSAASSEVARLNANLREQAALAAATAQSRLPELRKQQRELLSKSQRIRSGYEISPEGALLDVGSGIDQLYALFGSDEKTRQRLDRLAGQTLEQLQEVNDAITAAENAIKINEQIKKGVKPTTSSGTGGLPKLSPGYLGSTGGSSGGSGGSTASTIKESKTWLEQFQEALERAIPVNIARDFYYLQNAIEGTTQQVTRLTAEEEYLKAKLEQGNITQAERERLATVLAAKTKMLTQENDKLAVSNTMIERQLKYLNEALKTAEQRYRAVNTEAGKREALQAIEETTSKIKELTSAFDQNTQKIWENRKALMQTVDPAVLEVFRKARQAQHDLEMQWIEDEKQAELDRLNALKEKAKEASDARIKAIQDEIDAFDQENEVLDEQNKLLEARQALEEARQKLANVQAERNTRIFQNGVWTYVADPQAVKEAQEAVKEAEENLANTREEINRNRRKRELQDLLEEEREKQQAEQDSYDKQIKDLQDYWDKKQKDTEKRWKKLLSTEQLNMDAYKEVVSMGINAALSRWESYYRRVQQIMEETSSLVGVELPTLEGESNYTRGRSNVVAGENLTDVAARMGVTIGWNPKTGNVTINGKDALPVGGIPGTKYDPNTKKHIVIDPKLVEQFLNAVKSYQSGGPITSDQLAMLHSGEYVLNARNVQLLGGIGGVERLVANLSTPKISIPSFNPTFNVPVVPQVINNDAGVKINRLDLNMPHVYDVSGFVRNLKALSRS